MKSHNHKLYLFSFLCLFLLNPCALHSQKTNNSSKETIIPPDFGKEETILLIRLKGHKKHQKYFKKNIEKWYSGKYEFVDVIGPKYKDKDTYRYILGHRTYMTSAINSMNNSPSNSLVRNSFYIQDRKMGKSYKNDVGVSNSLIRLSVKSHLRKLDKKLQENK